MEKVKKERTSREKSFLIIAALYVVAIFMIVLIPPILYYYAFGNPDSLWLGLVSLLIGDVVATLFIWGMGLVFKNSSVYDPYWSVMPPFMAITAMILAGSFDAINLAAFAIVIIWAVRLTYNWSLTWKDFSEEDWRYADMRKNHKTWFVANLFGVNIMPTFLVFFGMLPLLVMALEHATFNWFMLIGAVISIGAICLETVADWQLRNFKKSSSASAVCNKGLWKLSRHPNYLGEILFWWGLYFIQLAILPSFWWTVVGPVFITLLFVFASIPMAEKNLASKTDYADYKKSTSMLIPLPKRKDKNSK